MAETVKRAALYIRVSTDEQAKHGFSLPEQKADLTAYAHEHGYFIAGVYADEGTTARKTITRRKELQRLLDDVRAGRIDIIIMKCLDRWFRNVRDYYNVQDILDAHGCLWECTQEEYNTTTTNGRLMLNLKLSIAQNESDQTSDRIKYVFEGKKARHEVLTGALPYGYKAENKHIVIDEAPAQNVRDLFKYFAIHQSVRETLLYARDTYGLSWWKLSIQRMLSNESYTGKFYGIEEYAPAIIDRDLFDRVQSLLKLRRRKIRKAPSGRVFLFKGLVKCPHCGNTLYGYCGNLNKTTGEYYHRYRCNLYYAEHKCTYSLCVPEKKLEKYLLENLAALLDDFMVDMAIKEKTAVKTPWDKIKAIQQKLERLKDLYVSGCIDRAAYMTDYKKYNADLDKATHITAHLSPDRKKEFQGLIRADISGMYQKLSLPNRSAFWRSIIKAITPNPCKKYMEKTYRITFLA